MSALDALSDPVRLRIVRHLAGGAAASLPELAEAAGVHRNTARPHAVALERAGVLVRAQTEPAGPGRPVVRYRLAESWTPPTADFRGLAELMAAALRRAEADPGDLRELGREWGRWLRGRPGAAEPGQAVGAAMERLGFAAELTGDEVRLTACPCPLVAPDHPATVCGLAGAVVEGVLAGAGTGRRVRRAQHDPARRACTLTLSPASPPRRR